MAENTDVVERKVKVVNRKFEERVGGSDIVSLNIDCSEGFAEEVLSRILPLVERDRQGLNLGLGNVNSFLPKTDATIVNQIANDEKSHSDGTGWGKGFAVAACLIFFVILSVFAFQTFLENRQAQALWLANHKKAKLETRAYEAVLARNSDNLLNNLNELTSVSYRFGIAFPEITSMAAIARFKRGSEPVEKAKAAKNFLLRVKENFDHWIERPDDFTGKERPTEKNIADFLSVWKETEFLLNIIEEERALIRITAIQG